ncbi:MAG TPA: hypothetical protein VI455_12725 [Terriglobia bacterium]
MATASQPPQLSQPPLSPPPRSGSNIVAIALLTVGLIVLLSVVAIWGGVRFLERGVRVHVNDLGADRKEVSIKTPFGGIEVNKNGGVSEASLGLPFYPAAKRAQDEDSASVSLAFPGKNGLQIVVGKFDSPDSLDKVRDFYQDRLTAQEGPFTRKAKIESNTDAHDLDSGEMGNFWGLGEDGKTIFRMKRKGEERVVALKSESDGTRIELVRIGKSSGEAN